MNFLNQGISFGRWFGIQVTVTWAFFLTAFWIYYEIQNLHLATIVIILLFGTVLVHEFGHALSCRALGGEAHLITLGPLGGTAFVNPPMNPTAWIITTLCGPLVNAVLWPTFWALNTYAIPHLHQYLNPASPAFAIIVECCYIMEIINKVLLLFNLIPAYPLDGGRLLQNTLWFFIGYARSLQVAGMVGTVCGAAFVILGLGLYKITIPYVNFSLGDSQGDTDIILIFIGGMCALQSFGIYKRSQEIARWRKN